MNTSSGPSKWRFLRAIGPVLILAAAVLTPGAIVFSSAHTQLSDENSFVETFSPLADDPDVQAHVVGMVVGAIDVPALVESATRELEAMGVPSWLTGHLTPNLEDSTAAITAGIDAVLTSLIDTHAFSIAWEESLRSSHKQVLEQLTSGDPAAPLHVDIHPIINATRDALIEEGAAFARYIPELEGWEYSAVLLSSQQMEEVGPVASRVLQLGASIAWVPVIVFAVGAIAVRNRPVWISVGGLLALAAAVASREIIASGAAQDAIRSRLAPLSAEMTNALLGTAFPPAASRLETVAIVAGVAAMIGGLLALHRRRSASRGARGGINGL